MKWQSLVSRYTFWALALGKNPQYSRDTDRNADGLRYRPLVFAPLSDVSSAQLPRTLSILMGCSSDIRTCKCS